MRRICTRHEESKAPECLHKYIYHKSIRLTPAIATIMFIGTSLFYFTTCFGPTGHHQVNHKPFFVSPRRLCPPTDPLFLVLHTVSVYLVQYNYYLMPLFTVFLNTVNKGIKYLLLLLLLFNALIYSFILNTVNKGIKYLLSLLFNALIYSFFKYCK
jgi:hypothetical protein